MSATDPRTDAARFRKKPVEVDAIQWTGNNLDALAEFVGTIDPPLMDEEDPGIVWIWVEKSNARCAVVADGWVIAEPDGEGYYPCTAAQFVATYERADAVDTRVQQLTDALQLAAGALHSLFDHSATYHDCEVPTCVKERAALAEVDASPKEDAETTPGDYENYAEWCALRRKMPMTRARFDELNGAEVDASPEPAAVSGERADQLSARPVPEDLTDEASSILRELWHRETGGHLAGSDFLVGDLLYHLGSRGLISWHDERFAEQMPRPARVGDS